MISGVIVPKREESGDVFETQHGVFYGGGISNLNPLPDHYMYTLVGR